MEATQLIGKKTIREYFNLLQEPYKSKALFNTTEDKLNTNVYNMKEALRIGFDWRKSKEKSFYWSYLFDKY